MKSFEQCLIEAALGGWKITVAQSIDYPGGIQISIEQGGTKSGMAFTKPRSSETPDMMRRGFCNWWEKQTI